MSESRLSRYLYDRLVDAGAVVKGHFELVSGLHSSHYVDKRRIYHNYVLQNDLCRIMAYRFHVTDYPVDLVIGPESGGVILANLISGWLSVFRQRTVPYITAKKDGKGGFYIENPEKVRGKEFLVVEDTISTGSSVKKVVRLVRAHSGMVDHCTAIWNRGGVTGVDIGGVVYFDSLITRMLPAWDPPCLLCAQGVPLNTHAKRSKLKTAATA